ncbi:MAG: BolA family transcriptional regulator [Rickettsiales bacterium]|nr:BolA family transcriptional regulator [Rickettsiales bacterium]
MQQILAVLETEFQPLLLNLRDDSHHHAGHVGARPEGETHFHLEMRSPLFSRKTRLQRHRMVMNTLKPLLGEGLHALSMTLYSPEEQT